jgi:hypothetical protein
MVADSKYLGYQPQVNRININRLIMIPTRKIYDDIYQRSYTLDANTGTLMKLEAIFQNNQVRSNTLLDNTTVAQTVPEVIKLSGMPTGMATIANGWRTQRLLFLLEAENIIGGVTHIIYVQGYTEYYDPTITGIIDPNMLFYINSITEVMRVPKSNGGYDIIPRNTYNVITDEYTGNRHLEVGTMDNDLSLIRPKDVIETMMIESMYGSDTSSIINTASNVVGNVSVSAKAHNDPSKYFTNTVNAYLDAKSIVDTNSTDYESILRQASSLVAETGLFGEKVGLIHAIHQITGDLRPTTFTLNILQMIDPMLSNKSTLIDNSRDFMNTAYLNPLDSDVTANQLQPIQENLKANTIAHAINAYMIENLLTSIDISFTNIGYEPTVVPSNATSFIEGIDKIGYVNRVIAKVRNILLPMISDSGQTIVEAAVHADLLGDTSVLISLNLNPGILFRFPTFADSLYVPVVTTAGNRASVVSDFGSIFDQTASYNQGIYY